MHLHVCVQEIDIIYTAKIKENFSLVLVFLPSIMSQNFQVVASNRSDKRSGTPAAFNI